MNNHLAPTYQKLFGTFWVCWYSKSNSYSVIDNNFKKALDLYFFASSVNEFKTIINDELVSDAEQLIKNIEDYLESCNDSENTATDKKIALNSSKREIKNKYSVKGKRIDIYYDSELVKKTIHPAIAHLTTEDLSEPKVIFSVYLDNDDLFLFKDEELIISVPKKNYHLIQGKFFMQLLTVIYEKDETEWIGTFHGSTIADGNNSILFVGNSGKGKSTLCGILAANGFELVADDVSPMMASDSHIYHNPSALSTKEGSFNVLRPFIDSFDNLPNTLFNKSKGVLKYIPFIDPQKDNYPCKAIVLVNYSENSKFNLESISIKQLLEVLIPESWLSHRPEHSKLFLDWLQTVVLYKLTYSNTEVLIREVSNLFKNLR